MKFCNIFLCFTNLVVVWVPAASLYDDEIITEDDYVEISNYVTEYEAYISPMLEHHGLAFDDLPVHLNFIIGKYCMIFSESKNRLDSLEKMNKDHQVIRNHHQIEFNEFQDFLESFVESVSVDDTKMIEFIVSNILDDVNPRRLQVITHRDAVKLILFQEGYPDIMELLSSAFRTFYKNYKKEHPVEEDEDIATELQKLIVSKGRMELVKRLILKLEKFLDKFVPPIQRERVDESLLDYVDELDDYLLMEANNLWDFVKSSSYIKKTDELIELAEDVLRKMLTFFPLQEILNFFDALVVDAYDRRALIILRYELNIWDYVDDAKEKRVTNAKDILNVVVEAFSNGLKLVYTILQETVTEEDIEVSRKRFLESLNFRLEPYFASSNDLSEDMTAILSRVFQRFNSLKGKSLSDTDNKNVLRFRNCLEKLRNSMQILSPVKDDSNEILLESMVQTFVNKYGPFALELEKSFVNFFNAEFNPSEHSKEHRRIVSTEQLTNEMEELARIARTIRARRKKFSDHFRERLSEVVETIDALVMLANDENIKN